MDQQQIAHPPETVEGWYALHQIYGAPAAEPDESAGASVREALRELACPPDGGWTVAVPLIGSRGDLMVMHFRPTLDELGVAQRRLEREPGIRARPLLYSFL